VCRPLQGYLQIQHSPVVRYFCPAPSNAVHDDLGGWTLEIAVALRIVCMCGYVIQGDDVEELWSNAQDRMGVLHPELVGNVTREDILAQAELL
jgi:hypothetical protein